MRNVGKRAAVNKRRSSTKRLHKVGVDCVFQQSGKCTLCVQLTGGDWRPVEREANSDRSESPFQICSICRKTQNSHDLGRGRDSKPCLGRHSIRRSTKSGDYFSQGPVIDVHATLPGDPPWVNAELIALMDVVIH